jgi:Protein of unknown function (DUF1642)
MNIGKVVLPREVAEAIESLRKNQFDNRAIINRIYKATAPPALQLYAIENFDTLLNALVNGYEIEKSPEEKVREYYEEIHEKHGKSFAEVPYGGKPPHYFSGVKDGIKTTLDILEIKIEGVNA